MTVAYCDLSGMMKLTSNISLIARNFAAHWVILVRFPIRTTSFMFLLLAVNTPIIPIVSRIRLIIPSATSALLAISLSLPKFAAVASGESVGIMFFFVISLILRSIFERSPSDASSSI